MTEARPVVRQATEEDLPKIADDYAGRISNPLYPFSSVDRLKQIPRQGLLLAEIDGAYAGFLYWFLASESGIDGNANKYAHIAEVKVKREYWHRKVGETLLSQALKDIEKREIPTLVVDSPEANMSLRTLYESIGFSTFSRTLHMRYLYPPDRHRTKRPHSEARELAVFLVELREQCRICMSSYLELMDTVAKGPPMDEDGKRVFNARIWSGIQATLASCTVVSKILWPNPVPKQDGSDRMVIHRGRELRQILKLRGASPFPVAVRNAFEHIDERLMAWLPEQEEDIPLGWSVSAFSKEDEPEVSSLGLRYFNVVTMDLRVADAQCNLREVIRQVSNINSRLPDDAKVFFESLSKHRTQKSN